MVFQESVPVEEVVAAIVARLRSAGYMESTIRLQSREAKRLVRWCHEHGDGQYTAELGARFAGAVVSPLTGEFSKQRYQSFGRLNRLADTYLELGAVELNKRSRTGSPKFVPQSSQLRALLESWVQELTDRHLSAGYRRQSWDMARRFLVFSEGRGHGSLDEITGCDVSDFLAKIAATYPKDGGRAAISAFRPFLKYTGRSSWVAAGSMFRLPRKRSILEPLTDWEITAVLDELASGRVTARDQAIVLLSLTSGLRACDIVGLMIEDIDWRAEVINVIQSKTGNPLSLPLLPVVGNALTGYLLNERPVTEDRHVFVRTKAPHHRFADHAAIYSVMKRVFVAAGVTPGRCGTLLARHSAASRMLAAGTPAPTISAVLGHVRPESVDRYLETDIESLRACVLPLPKVVWS